MRRRLALLVLLLAVIAGGLWSETRWLRNTTAPVIGIVLLHGKQGDPAQFGRGLATAFEAAGFPVDRPEMCWSQRRIYDEAFLDCLNDIDAAFARLRQRGATAFVIVGQSLGGSAALAYGARHDGLKGIIALAPAPAPGIARRPEIAPEIERANALVAAGHGDDKESFTDLNVAVRFTVDTTARIYLSFLAIDGPANLVANAVHLKAPVLWVSGVQDPTQMPRSLGFDRAAPYALNRYVEVEADHFGTPAAARDTMLAWLKEVAGR